MLANFNKSMRVSILISAIAIGAICVAGAFGIVQAAPEFNRVFDADSNPSLLAHNAATPASGYFGTAVKPARYAKDDVSEFTDAYQSKMQSASACRAMDAKLNKRHLPSFEEQAILAHHGCGISSTGSIES